MLLLETLPSEELAQTLSYVLFENGIENQCEGNEVWILDEEQMERAQTIYQAFLAKPPLPPSRQPRLAKKRWGSWTVTLIAICAILFLWGSFEVVRTKGKGGILFSPAYEALMYDYPEKLVLQKQFLNTFSVEELDNLSPEAQKLLQKLHETPMWEGFYGKIVDGDVSGPLFTDIRKGEVWRLFTPALLHGSILHILFNMIWLVVLGNQVEFRIGWWRYLLLTLLLGIISNTAQYLMGGPLFLGYSGIVCGLLGFIWMRQRRAAWEGYLLSRTTIIFLSVYIVGMALLQLISFFLELSGKAPIGIGLANTAHISGIIAGLLLGRLSLFSLQDQQYVSP